MSSHKSKALAVVQNMAHIEVRRGDGSLVERYLRPSEEQLKAAHEAGACGAWCGYCYHDACAQDDELEDCEVDGGSSHPGAN